MIECICCGNATPLELIKQKSFRYENREFHLYQCKRCESYTAKSDEILDGYQNQTPAFIHHYIEVGAGIDFMCRLFEVFLNSGKPLNSFMDVGCGFGFTVDFAKFMGFRESFGIEDAEYGQVGSRMLNCAISNVQTYLEQSDQVDFLISSEVIEHVSDTDKFVSDLKKHLNPGGLAVLTTPNGSWLRDKNFEKLDAVSLAVLSPGLHTCLFSENALKNLLLKYFDFVKISVQGERLIAYASDEKYEHVTNSELEKGRYLDYLRHLTKSQEAKLRQAAQFRLFKELVNFGKTDSECTILARELLSNIESSAVLCPQVSTSSIISFEDYSIQKSFNEPVVLFYLAQYYRNLGDYGGQFFFLSRALHGLKSQVSSFPQFAQVSSSLIVAAETRYFEALNFNLANISTRSIYISHFYLLMLPFIKKNFPHVYRFLRHVYSRFTL